MVTVDAHFPSLAIRKSRRKGPSQIRTALSRFAVRWNKEVEEEDYGRKWKIRTCDTGGYLSVSYLRRRKAFYLSDSVSRIIVPTRWRSSISIPRMLERKGQSYIKKVKVQLFRVPYDRRSTHRDCGPWRSAGAKEGSVRVSKVGSGRQ
jgi:hypothetical protein